MKRARAIETALSAKPTMIAIIFVIASFVLALWISHAQTAAIDRLARAISANAAPSIERLDEARTQLRRLAMSASEHVVGVAAGDSAPAPSIREARDRLAGEVVAFEALPSFEGKAAAFTRLTR